MSSIAPVPLSSITQDELPSVLITLLRGVMYREKEPRFWSVLLRTRSEATDYMAKLALVLHIDEIEGHAYLRNREVLPGENENPLRLLPRRQLSYNDSLLLALLRKRLAEFDATATDNRLILHSGQIHEMIALFLPEAADEVRLRARVDTSIKRLADMGFLRNLQASGESDSYEVLRVIKAFVDAEWLSGFESGLATYRTQESEKQHP